MKIEGNWTEADMAIAQELADLHELEFGTFTNGTGEPMPDVSIEDLAATQRQIERIARGEPEIEIECRFDVSKIVCTRPFVGDV